MARERVTILLEAKDRASREIRQAEGALGKLRGAGRAAAIAITAMVAAVTAGAVAFDKLAQRGGEVINLSRTFTRMFGNQEAALQKMRRATLGLVSDYELMKQANTALALGSANNAKEFSTLAETASTLGRALGLDVGFALNSLNIGIARQSRLVLDNVGIVMSVEEANQKYADALGVTVDALSDAQRQEAFRIGVMEAARQKIEEVGGAALNNADNITKMKVGFRNALDGASEWVAKSPAVKDALEDIARLAGNVADKVGAAGDALLRLRGFQTPSGAPPGYGPNMAAPQIPEGGPTPVVAPSRQRILLELERQGLTIPSGVGGPGTPPGMASLADLQRAIVMGLTRQDAGFIGNTGIIPNMQAPGIAPGKRPGALSAGQMAMVGMPMTEEQIAAFKGLPALKESADDLGEGADDANDATMALVGTVHSLAGAALDGKLSLDDLAASVSNIASAAVGGPLGAAIGAFGGLAAGLFAGDDDRGVPVRVRDIDDRAADKLNQRTERLHALLINGRRAEGAEEQRILGYQLKRVARLQGESVTGV